MYYSVSAINGFGIFDNKERLDSAIQYLKEPSVTESRSLESAFENAYSEYNSVQDDYDAAFFGSIRDVKRNWIMFRNQIIRKNMQEREND